MLDKFNKMWKSKVDLINLDTEHKKQMFFISKYYFGEGIENNEEIISQNILSKDSECDMIWFQSFQEETSILFIKLVDKMTISHDYSKLINNIRQKINSNEYIEYIENAIENSDLSDKGIQLNNKDDYKQLKIKYILINTDDSIIKNKDTIIDLLENDVFRNENESFEIIEQEDLNRIIQTNCTQELYIDSWEFKIDNDNNYLSYSNDDHNAIICNISANSLKELFKKYRNSTLNMNLRFFKKSKSVDMDIKQTIKENPLEFWFFNNGIYLICDKYEIKNNILKINKFSIINGGQTTFNISETDFEKDFFLISKIVSSKGWHHKENQAKSFEFANKIATASNKQKPINNKDLISNSASVTQFKDSVLKFSTKAYGGKAIFIESKKGEFSSLSSEEKTQYSKENVKTPEFFMQLYFCWEKLEPGTAKSGKQKMYNDKSELNDIFISLSEKENLELFSKLLWIHNCLKTEFKKECKNLTKSKENEQSPKWYSSLENLGKYFDFFIISLIRIMLCVIQHGSDFYNDFLEQNDLVNQKRVIEKYNVTLKLQNKIKKNEFAKALFHIFKEIFKFIIDALNESYPNSGSSQTHNFVKSDSHFFVFAKHFVDTIKRDSDTKNSLKELFDNENN